MKVYAIISFEVPDKDILFEELSDLVLISTLGNNAHLVISTEDGDTLAELDVHVHQVSKVWPT